jgi:ABC-type cobalamin/Fe3+-siderophores transport system ATPase subunit
MPSIQEFRIEGYRSFSTEQLFVPAVPDSNRPGTGMTWVVGPNNSGKSSLLEAIEMCALGQNIQLERSYRNKSTMYRTNAICTWSDGRKAQLQSNPSNPTQLLWSLLGGEKKTTSAHRVVYVPSISRIPTQIEIQTKGIEALYEGANAFQRQDRQSFLTSRMARWLTPQSRALSLFRSVLDFEVNLYPEGQRLNVEVHGIEHPPEGLGTGISTIAHLVDAIYELPDGATVMIDEPEQRLHPSYQRRLLAMLSEESKRLQIILCTHSPFLVDWNSLETGARLVRLSRESSNYTQINALSVEIAKKISPLLRDLFNPHVFGINATEFLFLPDRIVLVEGQEDVIYLRRGMDQHGFAINAEFYGWGVGGAEKMRLIARVLHELGFHRVTGLLDRDKASLAEELSSEFPEFTFIVLPTDDIRDKSRVQKDPKRGLFRSDGSIDAADIETLKSIHLAIESSFKSAPNGKPVRIGG